MNTLLVIVAVAAVCFLPHATPTGNSGGGSSCSSSQTKGKQDFNQINLVNAAEGNGNLAYVTTDENKVRVAFLLDTDPRPEFKMISLRVKFSNVADAKAIFLLNNNFDNSTKRFFTSDGSVNQVYDFDDVPTEEVLNKITISANCGSSDNVDCGFQIIQMNVCEEEDEA